MDAAISKFIIILGKNVKRDIWGCECVWQLVYHYCVSFPKAELNFSLLPLFLPDFQSIAKMDKSLRFFGIIHIRFLMRNSHTHTCTLREERRRYFPDHDASFKLDFQWCKLPLLKLVSDFKSILNNLILSLWLFFARTDLMIWACLIPNSTQLTWEINEIAVQSMDTLLDENFYNIEFHIWLEKLLHQISTEIKQLCLSSNLEVSQSMFMILHRWENISMRYRFFYIQMIRCFWN